MYVFFITAVIIAAVIVILNITLLFEISYGTGKHNKNFEIWLKYLFIRIKIYPAKNKNSEEKNNGSNKDKHFGSDIDLSKFSQYITQIKDGYNILKEDIINVVDYLEKKGAIFKEIEFKAEFGLENACSTGIAYGVANATVYGILGFLHNTFTINHWNIELTPDFNSQHTDIYVLFILKTRLKHIIKIFWNIFIMCMKYNKYSEK